MTARRSHIILIVYHCSVHRAAFAYFSRLCLRGENAPKFRQIHRIIVLHAAKPFSQFLSWMRSVQWCAFFEVHIMHQHLVLCLVCYLRLHEWLPCVFVHQLQHRDISFSLYVLLVWLTIGGTSSFGVCFGKSKWLNARLKDQKQPPIRHFVKFLASCLLSDSISHSLPPSLTFTSRSGCIRNVNLQITPFFADLNVFACRLFMCALCNKIFRQFLLFCYIWHQRWRNIADHDRMCIQIIWHNKWLCMENDKS